MDKQDSSNNQEKLYPIRYNKKREFKTKKQLKELIRQVCDADSDTPISEEKLQHYTDTLAYILGGK